MSRNPLHMLCSTHEQPHLFTYPFCYEPHPLCLEAAAMVQRHIRTSGVMDGEHGGKMFGVLVVRDGTELGFLAAYSGLLSGRNDWPYFVPPIFDAQRPEGHFKQTEQQITAINNEIDDISQSAEYHHALNAYVASRLNAESQLAAMKAEVAAAKQRRNEIRLAAKALGVPLDKEVAERLTRESQYMKAQLKRLGKRLEQSLDTQRQEVTTFESRIQMLASRRRQMSDDLQRWLFSQYRMLNARGEERDLMQIFADTTAGLPPAGSGDCCAPKLLQWAYLNGLQPVCMAEFWWGPSPQGEIRHHLHYYPACRSKCLPILTFMLQGLDVEPNPLARNEAYELRIVYEDDTLAVVDKPSGMLSVPGKDGLPSVDEVMRERWHISPSCPIMPHRLDKDTSGLMIVARSLEAYTDLQRQFAHRQVTKRYEALLDGVPAITEGHISLPLMPDITDRPRQCVDFEHGKAATTDYKVVRVFDTNDGPRSLVWLYPHTGRTHQLRVHCAHNSGLACPILGDPLYGHDTKTSRMWLQASELSFVHPRSKEPMHFVLPEMKC